MTRKFGLYALAVVVLMGTMGAAALADDHGMDAYGPADSSVSSLPERGVEESAVGEIREPMETGAIPDRPESSSDMYSNPSGDEPTLSPGWSLFRPDIEGSP